MKKITSAVPQELLPPIGLVTVNFRILQMYLEMGIWKLLGADNEKFDPMLKWVRNNQYF